MPAVIVRPSDSPLPTDYFSVEQTRWVPAFEEDKTDIATIFMDEEEACLTAALLDATIHRVDPNTYVWKNNPRR